MHIILFQPEIPGNTGNIARLCAATNCELHLIRPLGFSIDDKHLKRAGLDYWHLVKVHVHDSLEEVAALNQGHQFYFNTTKAKKAYTDIAYKDDDFLVFGRETAGLPEALLKANQEYCVRIPMVSDARSLNLSNSVAIVVYEALRQIGFPKLC